MRNKALSFSILLALAGGAIIMLEVSVETGVAVTLLMYSLIFAIFGN